MLDRRDIKACVPSRQSFTSRIDFFLVQVAMESICTACHARPGDEADVFRTHRPASSCSLAHHPGALDWYRVQQGAIALLGARLLLHGPLQLVIGTEP